MRESVITTLVRRVLPLGGLVVLIGVLVRGQRTPPAHADAWFHLRFGREFLGSWSVRDPGHLGPYDSADWIPTQWLAQVGMARLEELGGMASLIWVTGAIAIAIVGLLYVSCRASTAPLPAAIATGLGMLAAMPGLSARPQILSYLFIVLTLNAWLATARDGRPRYWLIVLAWLWTMSHGMWPIGISISVAAVVGIGLQREHSRSMLARLAAIPAASVLVAALTPVGFDSFRALAVVGSRASYFAEWGATDFRSPPAATLAAMIVVIAISNMRAPMRSWTFIALFTVGVAWALFSLRTTPVAALILTPLLANALQRLVPESRPMPRVERLVIGGAVLGGFVGLGVVAAGEDTVRVVPAWVDVRLDAMPADARVLNDWDSGSYFLSRHPGLALVMHGYGDVFTDAELDRNVDVVRLRPGWDDLVSDLDTDVALLQTDSALRYALERQLGWTSIQDDDDYALLAPPERELP